MGRPSKIDRLPPEIRDLIAELRFNGRTIDEIMDHLARLKLALDEEPSRSGLGRHVQGLDKLAERANRGRVIAEALVRKLGDGPESRQARLNIELMHTAITDVMLKISDSAESGEAIVLGAKDIHDLAKSIDHLSRAAKNDAEVTLELREVAQGSEDAPTAAAPQEAADFRLPVSGR